MPATATTTTGGTNSSGNNGVDTSRRFRSSAGSMMALLGFVVVFGVVNSFRNISIASSNAILGKSAGKKEEHMIQPTTLKRKAKTITSSSSAATTVAVGRNETKLLQEGSSSATTTVTRKQSSFASTSKNKETAKESTPLSNDKQTSDTTPPLITTTRSIYPNVTKEEIQNIRTNVEALKEYNQTLLTFPQTSTIPWPNVTTLAFYEGRFYSGFRNQMMAFTILILEAIRKGHGQFLMNSVNHKDTYGTNRGIKLSSLWDIPHWNSHYPALPRLVEFDPIVHTQYNISLKTWYRVPVGTDSKFTDIDKSIILDSPTKPFAFGKQAQLMSAYMRYANKGTGPYPTEDGHRHPAEILMMQGALRPHPGIRQLITEKLQILAHGNNSTTTTTTSAPIEYMTLHARVEPDMQKHTVCVPKKVLNLTQIFDMMERQWPDPPAPHLFMPINREYLEKEGDLTLQKKKKKKKNKAANINWIAVNNLNALNAAVTDGLWNGRVKVFEFGAKMLKGTRWEQRPSTTGALLNFFIGVNAKVFVGTEVSSYSHDLLATRFFKGNMENYKYLPDGLHLWTPPGIQDPPGFGC